MKLPHTMLPSDDKKRLNKIIEMDNETMQEELCQIDTDLYQLKRFLEKNSPVIRIQACFRGMIGRKITRKI
jgi:hypothetical protein